jgi:hypothetical protein
VRRSSAASAEGTLLRSHTTPSTARNTTARTS